MTAKQAHAWVINNKNQRITGSSPLGSPRISPFLPFIGREMGTFTKLRPFFGHKNRKYRPAASLTFDSFPKRIDKMAYLSVILALIKLFFRRINSRLCCKAGHFNKALSKAPSSTTSIWNLHADAHDFDSLEIN